MEGHVTSADGTRIGFLRRGSGPGLVLVNGAMGLARDYSELARALSGSFTVYTPDRRGRGTSPKPYEAGHTIARDVEDVDAVLAESGATRVFGLSSGGVIALEAARTLPRVERAAVYEPPFYASGIDHAGIRRLGAEIERGDAASALVTSLRTAGTAPAPVRVLPRPAARILAATVLAVDDRRAEPGARFRDLLPGIRYDFASVGEMDGRVGAFADLGRPVLLLGGTRSPAFLQQALRTLEQLLPRARRVVFDGLGHDGPWNRTRGGRPDLVAAALRDFG